MAFGDGQKLLKISTTEITDFKLCRELHRLRWVLRVVPIDYVSTSLQTGGGVHKALDIFRTTDLLDPAFVALAESGLDGYALAGAQAMLAGYAARWHEQHLEWLGVEQYFTIVREGFVLHGKIDGIARDTNGEIAIVETKTTGSDVSPGAQYWELLGIDDQIGIYLPGARELGYAPSYVLYDVLRRPQVEPKLATPPEKRKYRKEDGQLYANQRESDESVFDYQSRVLEHMEQRPLEYFARERLVSLEEEEQEQRASLLRIVDEMRATYADPETPAPKSPTACRRYGRLCEYAPLCTKRDTLESTNWRNEREQTQQDPQGNDRGAVVGASVRSEGSREDSLW